MAGAAANPLTVMLAALRPALHDLVYRYCPWPEGDALPQGGLALIREAEGLCAILPEEFAAAQGLAVAPYRAACITLHLPSDLAAVGLTAAFATALAAKGLSANVLAGLHHDHILVPWERRAEALAVLERLSDEARAAL